MQYQTLCYEVSDRLLLLTLNRPEHLNVFTAEMANELVAAYQRASEDDTVAVIVVTDRSPVSVALIRQMLYRNAAQPSPLEAHRIESLAMFYASIGDGKEGVQAFLDKRSPSFSARASQMPPFCEDWPEDQ